MSDTNLPDALILTEAYAGLQSQAVGLAEAAGFASRTEILVPRAPWKWITASAWPRPVRAVGGVPLEPRPHLLLGAGGTAAAVAAELRRPDLPVVHVQHPRMDIRRFDLIVVNRHDRLEGPNVLVTRTALHRVTQARLAAAAAEWAPRFAHLPRPLVSVLLGGSNGRFRLDLPVAEALVARLAGMMEADRVGLAVTPSRRTDPAVTRLFAERLGPRGALVWDGTGENPYFGMLALADAIVVTEDSVSMVSEAAATPAPVLLALLPGRSRRIRLFTEALILDKRVRPFAGRLEMWPVTPMDDTGWAGAEIRRRLKF
jgi:mitochondrial fission protein ELM1